MLIKSGITMYSQDLAIILIMVEIEIEVER